MIEKFDNPTFQNSIFLLITPLDPLFNDSDKHIELTAHMRLVQSLPIALILNFLLVLTHLLVLLQYFNGVLLATHVHVHCYYIFVYWVSDSERQYYIV